MRRGHGNAIDSHVQAEQPGDDDDEPRVTVKQRVRPAHRAKFMVRCRRSGDVALDALVHAHEIHLDPRYVSSH
jgi:hypothetical protein